MRKVFVVAGITERDSDTGHDSYFLPEVYGCFEDESVAEELVRRLMTNGTFAKKFPLTTGQFPEFARKMENRDKKYD